MLVAMNPDVLPRPRVRVHVPDLALQRGRRSIPLVAGFHAVFNLFTGTLGARGGIAAAESTTIIIIAVFLASAELRARRHAGRTGHHVMAPHPVR